MSDAAHNIEEVKKHVRVYISVFAALAILTVVTVGVGYLHLPILPALIAALVIASIKAGLVAAYFMHLVSEERVIRLLVWMSLGLLVFMFTILSVYYYDQVGAVTGL
ncbi:MAG: cytochrome C oxidase subunit IV family protein [Rhodothermales bacterium]